VGVVLGAVVDVPVLVEVDPGRATLGTDVVVDGGLLTDSCGRVATCTEFCVPATIVVG
jgi:hypothetical protein